jgi:DNA-binding transcriptional MerR regulator
MAIAPMRSREIQLFEPPSDAVYTVEEAAHFVDVAPRTILVYCRHRLLSPVINASDRSYSFDRESIRSLRCIETLRTICGNDFAGIKIILDLTNELEYLRSEVHSLSQPKSSLKTKSQSSNRRT